MRSESTSALGQPSETKPILGGADTLIRTSSRRRRRPGAPQGPVSQGRSYWAPREPVMTLPPVISRSTFALPGVPSSAMPALRQRSPQVASCSAILWLTSTTRPLAGQR